MVGIDFLTNLRGGKISQSPTLPPEGMRAFCGMCTAINTPFGSCVWGMLALGGGVWERKGWGEVRGSEAWVRKYEEDLCLLLEFGRLPIQAWGQPHSKERAAGPTSQLSSPPSSSSLIFRENR